MQRQPANNFPRESGKREWFPVLNADTIAIPPYALLRVTGTAGAALTVLAPDTDGQTNLLFNSSQCISPNGTGQAHRTFPAIVAYRQTTGTTPNPVNGQTWGAAAGSYLLTAGKTGFSVLTSGANGLTNVLPATGAGSSTATFTLTLTDTINTDLNTSTITVGAGLVFTKGTGGSAHNDTIGLGLTITDKVPHTDHACSSITFNGQIVTVGTGASAGSDTVGAAAADTNVQVNKGGAMYGDASFTYSTGSVVVTSTETTGLGLTFTTTLNYNFGGTGNTYGVYSTNSAGGFGIINVVSNDGISGYYGGFYQGQAGLTPSRVGLGSDSYAVDAQSKRINAKDGFAATGTNGISGTGSGGDVFTLGIVTAFGSSGLTGTFP